MTYTTRIRTPIMLLMICAADRFEKIKFDTMLIICRTRKTYGHAIVCAAKHGFFDIPVELIKAGIRLL